jgi:hypothetical protein
MERHLPAALPALTSAGLGVFEAGASEAVVRYRHTPWLDGGED